MKKIYAILLTMAFLSLIASHSVAQVYVDQTATGANDGTSWENAYTDLSTPLGIIAGGSIWVAEGTYLPGSGTPDTSSSFVISSSISIYGGFKGDETMLDQRDIDLYETILSGDINGDDVGDFVTNRTDNAHNVVVVDSMLIGCTIDGFTISGGHTSDINSQPEIEWRGGGIFSYSLTVVRNCLFTSNFARSGGGIYFSPNGGGSGSNGSEVSNCTFSNNATSSQGAGIFASAINGLEVSNCDFIDNATNRGAFYPVNSNNVSITDCKFERNIGISSDVFGGAIFSFQTTNFSIKKTLFTENQAGNAGVIYGLTISNSDFVENSGGNGAILYHDGRDVAMDANNLIIDNCNFTDNQATDFGGGVAYVFDASITVKNSEGIDNLGTNGSHLFLTGSNKEVVITDCEFKGGNSNFGGVAALYGANSNFLLERNSFIENTAGNQGGALIIGFQANATINDCDFRINSADLGGAVRIQNDSTFATFNKCLFESNTATTQAGAIYQGGGSKVTYSNSDFFVNTTNGNSGALALTTFNNDAEQGTADISNCTFNFNGATEYGGAIGIIDMPTTITNTLIHDNIANATDALGGGIFFEVSDSNTAELSLINTTMANNFAIAGSGIALFKGAVETSMALNLQNSLHFNNGDNLVVIDDSTPELNSLGGNLSSDITTTTILTAASDLNDVADAMFVDQFTNYDFHLQEGSPAIDAGISAGAPTTDIEGTERFGAVDAGAYEFDPTSSVWDLLDNSALVIAPNPVESTLNFELNSPLNGDAVFQIFNNQGQLLQEWTTKQSIDHLKARIELNEMPAGSYRLFVRTKTKIISQQFVKI